MSIICAASGAVTPRKPAGSPAPWRATSPPARASRAPPAALCCGSSFPPRSDSTLLYDSARSEGMTIAPGVLFSTGAEYRHCFRLNSAYTTPETEPFIATLGRLAAMQIGAAA